MAFSQPAIWQFMYALRKHAVIVPGQPSEDIVGSIGGPIIDDNDFEPDVALIEQVTNSIFDSRFFITRCHDDRALNATVVRTVA